MIPTTTASGRVTPEFLKPTRGAAHLTTALTAISELGAIFSSDTVIQITCLVIVTGCAVSADRLGQELDEEQAFFDALEARMRE